MFRVIFGILALVLLCGFAMAQYGSGTAPYNEPMAFSNVPVPVGSVRPEPLPVRQERQLCPVMPYCPPQSAPVVIQSANDTAMLEAVRQGKDFRMEVTLRDPSERQWHEAMEWRGATQYQQQPYTVTPYYYPQYRQQRQYLYGEQNVDIYGRNCWWWGNQWMTCPPPARQNYCW